MKLAIVGILALLAVGCVEPNEKVKKARHKLGVCNALLYFHNHNINEYNKRSRTIGLTKEEERAAIKEARNKAIRRYDLPALQVFFDSGCGSRELSL